MRSQTDLFQTQLTRSVLDIVSWFRHTRAFILSPHSDDAAFSIGATLAGLSRRGTSIALITCFSYSRFSRWPELKSVPVISSIRKREDEAFAAKLCPGCSLLWLDQPDAPLRGYSKDTLRKQGQLYANERKLVQTVFEQVMPILSAESAVFVPLAVGNHVDHIIVREAGLHFAREGHKVIFYEDLPYAALRSDEEVSRLAITLEHRLNARLFPRTIVWPGAVKFKQEIVKCYDSQVEPALGRRALAMNERYKVERLWQLELPGRDGMEERIQQL